MLPVAALSRTVGRWPSPAPVQCHRQPPIVCPLRPLSVAAGFGTVRKLLDTGDLASAVDEAVRLRTSGVEFTVTETADLFRACEPLLQFRTSALINRKMEQSLAENKASV